MAGLFSWVDANFNIIQTAGILGGLLLTAAAAHRDAKAREIENLLTISGQHRQLWKEAIERADLQRVFEEDTDVLLSPPTVAENEFTNMAIVQYETGWKLAKAGGITSLKELSNDMRGFFSLPLPRAVWEKTRSFRNRQFVRFVEKAIERRRWQKLATS